MRRADSAPRLTPYARWTETRASEAAPEQPSTRLRCYLLHCDTGELAATPFGDGHDWRGRLVSDRDGVELGDVGAVYLDPVSQRPKFVALSDGPERLGKLIPLTDAVHDGDRMRVAYSAALVRDAPDVGGDEELLTGDEVWLLAHYRRNQGARGQAPSAQPRQRVAPDLHDSREPSASVAQEAPARGEGAGEVSAWEVDHRRLHRATPRSQEGDASVRRSRLARGRPGPEDGAHTGGNRSSRRATDHTGRAGLSFAAAASGWLASVGLGALLAMVAGALATVVSVPASADGTSVVSTGGALLMLTVLASYFGGGYVAGRMAARRGGRHGLAVWGIALLVTLALTVLGALVDLELSVLEHFGLPRVAVDDAAISGLEAAGLLAVVLGAPLAGWAGGRTGERGAARPSVPVGS